MKNLLKGAALAALLIAGFVGAADAQTGACPAGTVVTVINNNIVGSACNAPFSGGSTAGALLQGGSPPAFSQTLTGAYDFTNPLITSGIAAGTPTHIGTQSGTAPALTSCGSGSPAITGTDTAGIVTMGTSATGCVITFNVAYTSAPYCVVSWIATPLASQSYVTSATAITTTQTSTSGNKLQYVCLAQAGG